MKVSVPLAVSAQSFYTYLLKQIKTDIQASKNTVPATLEELDGYTYSRFLKRQKKDALEIRIQVGPLIEYRYYEVKYQTPTASNRYFYDITEVDEHHIEVTYCEDNSAKGSINNWFYKTRVKFREANVQMRVKETLKAIEQQLQGDTSWIPSKP